MEIVKNLSKTILTAVTSIGLALGFAVAPANAAPVTKFSYASIQRQVTSDTFTLRANETIKGVVNASISSFASDGVTAISSDHGITPLIPGVTYGQKSYQWTSNGCTPSMVNTVTATPCGGATSIEVYVFQNVTNTTGSPITITANLSSAKFTYGSDEISATQDNVSANKFVSGTDPMMTTGLVLTSDDTYVNGNIDACLDDTLYDVGDTLTWSSSASINGTALANEYSFNNTYMYFRNGGNALTSFEVAAGQMTTLYIDVQGGSINLTPGTLSISVDLKNDGVSVLKACPTGGGGPGSDLFPTGGASVSGTFSAGSKIKVTPNTWSLTAGGASVAATNRYVWYVCDTALSASTTDFMNVSCFDNQPAQVLANGTSVGITNGPNQSWTASELTITSNLLNALNGKHLMVIILGSFGSSPSKTGEVFMRSCGPIASGSSCSSTFGTPTVVTPAKKSPKAATVATKVRIGKTFTIALHASKGTATKGANADGLGAVISVTSASKKYCSATKIVKSGKITGYTIKGLKAGKCSVVVAISGSTTFNASTKTTSVTVSK